MTPAAAMMAMAVRGDAMGYPGGKAQHGVYQTIINQIPPHRVFIEPFVGGGAILRRLRPSPVVIAVDADVSCFAALRADGLGHVEFVHGCGVEFLRSYPWAGGEFVYADPPYLASVRSSTAAIYACEFRSDEDHRRLLGVLLELPALVMVSGYSSPLYELALGGWRTVRYQAMTRGGVLKEETLWCNYPEPVALHDYRFLGGDFRERERIRRKQARWRRMLAEMPRLERLAMVEVVVGGVHPLSPAVALPAGGPHR